MSNIVISGDTSGSSTLQAPAVAGGSVLTLPVATDTLVGKATTDVLTNKTLTSPIIDGTPTGVGVLTSGTALSASGATISFTAIPTWANRITVTLTNVGTVGSGIPAVRAGNGSYENSGYTATNVNINATSTGGAASSLTSWDLIVSGGPGYVYSGTIIITKQSGLTYTISSQLSYATTAIAFTSGYKTFPGLITQLQILMSTGADTFDTGTINIMYE